MASVGPASQQRANLGLVCPAEAQTGLASGVLPRQSSRIGPTLIVHFRPRGSCERRPLFQYPAISRSVSCWLSWSVALNRLGVVSPDVAFFFFFFFFNCCLFTFTLICLLFLSLISFSIVLLLCPLQEGGGVGVWGCGERGVGWSRSVARAPSTFCLLLRMLVDLSPSEPPWVSPDRGFFSLYCCLFTLTLMCPLVFFFNQFCNRLLLFPLQGGGGWGCGCGEWGVGRGGWGCGEFSLQGGWGCGG